MDNAAPHMDDQKAFCKAMEALRTQVQQEIVDVTNEIHALKVNFQRQKIIAELTDFAQGYSRVKPGDYLPIHPKDQDDFTILINAKRKQLDELQDMMDHLGDLKKSTKSL